MIRWKRSWPDLSDRMPYDVLPASNGEYVPRPPTAEERLAMRIQEEVGEEVRRRLGMSRRQFVRSAAALSVGLWAMQAASNPRWAWATHKNPLRDPDCVLNNPNAQLANLAGEFIFDIQTHHVDEDGLWRVQNPGFALFFAAVWNQSGCGDPDRLSCLGRYHYMKEIYMDSSTTMGVLSAVPSSPDRNPLPTTEAFETVQLLNQLAGNQTRAVMHAFVMPNRGGYGGSVNPPLFRGDELDAMSTAVTEYGGLVRAWKCYTPWGDIPNVSGWFHDDPNGRAMIERALAIGVPVIATHKGFALPSFDQRAAACRDIGIVARDYHDPADDANTIKMIVYHSGFDSETQAAYAGDEAASSSSRGVDSLIKSLRENGWSARHFAPGGTPGLGGTAGDGDTTKHANSPNVYAEIGSTWRSVMNRQAEAAHLLGKLIYYVGPRRVVWGTDSLWYGSPQSVIARLREFPRANETEAWNILQNTYNLPHGLDGDVDDPSINAVTAGTPARSIRNGIFGRNAAVPYGVDPDAAVDKTAYAITCSELEQARSEYIQNPGTPQETRPLASNVVYGPRSRRELLRSIWPNKPWAP